MKAIMQYVCTLSLEVSRAKHVTTLNPNGTLTIGIHGTIQEPSVVAHEAWHDLWIQDNGKTASTLQEITDSEIQTYGVTNTVLHE